MRLSGACLWALLVRVQQAAGGKGSFVHSHVKQLLADLAAQGVRHPARYDEIHPDLSGPQYMLGL